MSDYQISITKEEGGGPSYVIRIYDEHANVLERPWDWLGLEVAYTFWGAKRSAKRFISGLNRRRIKNYWILTEDDL